MNVPCAGDMSERQAGEPDQEILSLLSLLSFWSLYCVGLHKTYTAPEDSHTRLYRRR